MEDLESGSKLGASTKKTGTVVLDKESGKFYLELDKPMYIHEKKERVAFGPMVDPGQLKGLVGKKAEAFMAYNGTDAKTSLAAVLIGGTKCYLVLCYVVPVLKRYLDRLDENTVLGFDTGSKVHFIDTMAANKAFSLETAKAMKAAINATRPI